MNTGDRCLDNSGEGSLCRAKRDGVAGEGVRIFTVGGDFIITFLIHCTLRK